MLDSRFASAGDGIIYLEFVPGIGAVAGYPDDEYTARGATVLKGAVLAIGLWFAHK